MSAHGAAKYIRHSTAPVPHVPFVYRFLATGLGATMWFWIFYRAKHDYKHWFVSIVSFFHYILHKDVYHILYYLNNY